MQRLVDMVTDQNCIIVLIIMAVSFHTPRLSLITKGVFLPTLILKTPSAYSEDLPKNRWQNDSPLSTFNPAVIPINFSPKARNNINTHNHLIMANQALSIHKLFNNWEGPFNPKNTNTALMSSEMELTFGRDIWRLSYINRIELFLWASRGLMELIWYDKNKKALPLNKDFSLCLEGNGFAAHGIKFSYGKAFSYMKNKKIGCGIAMSFLKGNRVQKIFMQGEAHVSGTKDYDYYGDMTYYYNHNYLYDRKDIDNGNGNGVTFDIGLGMDITKRLSASLVLHDIWGMIWWQDVPYTNASFDSHNKEYDEDGYVKYNPSIYGRESTDDFTQRIYPKTNLCFNYHMNKWAVLISSDFIEKDIYPEAYFNYYFSDSMSLNCGYCLFFSQIKAGIRYHMFYLGISFDEIDPKRAKAISLCIDFDLRF